MVALDVVKVVVIVEKMHEKVQKVNVKVVVLVAVE